MLDGGTSYFHRFFGHVLVAILFHAALQQHNMVLLNAIVICDKSHSHSDVPYQLKVNSQLVEEQQSFLAIVEPKLQE
jgi:hypothetical protein